MGGKRSNAYTNQKLGTETELWHGVEGEAEGGGHGERPNWKM